MQTQHGKEAGGRRRWEATPPSGDPRNYRIALVDAGGPRNCLVEGFPGRAATTTAIRVHLFFRFVRDYIIFLEEGNLSHIRFPLCGILVPGCVLIRRHLATDQCAKGGKD